MLKEFLRNWSPRSSATSAARQSGAIPYTWIDGQLVLLLITSRHLGRWIFPKGALIESLPPWESAAQEAFEEAGVSGEIARTPVGSYRTTVSDAQRSVTDVDLYPLRVTEQHDAWPEMAERLRHWVILPEARRLLANRQLAELAAAVSRQARN